MRAGPGTEDRSLKDQLEIWQQQGFARLLLDGQPTTIPEMIERITADHGPEGVLHLVIDRLARPEDAELEEFEQRLADSVDTAFYEGHGACELHWVGAEGSEVQAFSDRFELDGMAFELPPHDLFSFNSPQGACPKCEGFGHVIGISEDLVIPDPSKSVYDNCVAPWRGEKASRYKQRLLQNAYDFRLSGPHAYADLTAQPKLVWNSADNGHRRLLRRPRGQELQDPEPRDAQPVPGQDGLYALQRKPTPSEAGYVRIDGHALPDLLSLPVEEVLATLQASN